MLAAWQKRGSERQKLIEKLLQGVWEKEEEFDLDGVDAKIFKFELTQILLEYLKRRSIKTDQKQTENIAGAFFWEHLFVEITRFSRAQEETEWLVGELLGNLIDSVQSLLSDKLRELEQLNPSLIFHAPTATSRVSLG